MSAGSLPSYSYEGGGAPSSGDNDGDSIFASDDKRTDSLKTMLDGSKDGLKLEAMKKLIGMIAKGRNVADLFPAVVKNVLSKNNELKKLVYVYLVRYAEEEQDLALLSISAFQKALKDPNQLIRASALRVLSSIRVPVIVPIMMLSIKESSGDMSPFVRKTAAHAIPKLYSLDETQKDSLIEVIEKLLKDRTTLVAGSAVMAFEMVCPEKIDLIHKNFHKLCGLLVDVDEWGQVAIINMLTRYARSQFLDPNLHEDAGEEAFYAETESSEETDDNEDDDEDKPKKKKKKPYTMDNDHRLLLRNCKPLLQSRNSAVVMAVVQLYFHLAPKAELSFVIKPLLRLLHSHREVQAIVLTNVATLSLKYQGLFEPYVKSFFVHAQDATHVRNLKLEILTNIASETSISTILRELQTYVRSSDRAFVSASIQAIGRCASRLEDVTEACVSGLVRLMQHHDEAVVAESVVVVKKLLQLQPSEHKEIIVHIAKMAHSIKVPMARASVLWLIGEYTEHVLKLAPDVLRIMTKSFPTEEDIVKLQVLNLAGKLLLTNPKQTKVLCQYVLNMAKYDLNYDIRDRARFLRQLLFPAEKGVISKHAKRLLLSSKPPPVMESPYKDRLQYQVGSLTHMIGSPANGYQPLPDFPEEAPDPSVRAVEVDYGWSVSPKKKQSKKRRNNLDSFYATSSSEEESDDEEDSDEDSEEESDEYTDDEEEEDSDEEEEESDDDDDDDEESDEEESEEESSDEEPPVKAVPKVTKSSAAKKVKASSQQESLLLLDDFGSEPSTSVPSTMPLSPSVLQPTTTAMQAMTLSDKLQVASSCSFTATESEQLLHRIAGRGLAATYRFTRRSHIFSDKMVDVEVCLTNSGDSDISDLSVRSKKLDGGMTMNDFHPVATLSVGDTKTVSLGVDFKDTLNPANFNLAHTTGSFPVKIVPCVGELLQGVVMAEGEFGQRKGKLTGMNESSGKVTVAETVEMAVVCQCVLHYANVAQVRSNKAEQLLFAGQTISGQVPVLIQLVRASPTSINITVNCEKMVFSSMLVKDIKAEIAKI